MVIPIGDLADAEGFPEELPDTENIFIYYTREEAEQDLLVLQEHRSELCWQLLESTHFAKENLAGNYTLQETRKYHE